MPYIAYVYLGLLPVMSIATLAFFAVDKKNSSREGRGRVPEIVLLSLCSFGGALGALSGCTDCGTKPIPLPNFTFL